MLDFLKRLFDRAPPKLKACIKHICNREYCEVCEDDCDEFERPSRLAAGGWLEEVESEE